MAHVGRRSDIRDGGGHESPAGKHMGSCAQNVSMALIADALILGWQTWHGLLLCSIYRLTGYSINILAEKPVDVKGYAFTQIHGLKLGHFSSCSKFRRWASWARTDFLSGYPKKSRCNTRPPAGW